MRKWLRTIPRDQRGNLESLREYRSALSLQDDWGAIFEWLNMQSVEPPEHPLPTEPEATYPIGHH